jgi:methylphosphotriester-DNA--protein-cysteine methyltransferase
MIKHTGITDEDLRKQIKQKQISFAGNIRLKIYGRLNCGSGKRMKKENRVFFISEEEAKAEGFRACGNCMRNKNPVNALQESR